MLLLAAAKVHGQVFHPTNWVNDPFCTNANYSLTGADSSNPCFANNGVQRGSLFFNAPIGSDLKLTGPGDTLSLTGQVAVAGNVNAEGHLQFRLGLFYKGENKADTNWLGYMFCNVTDAHGNVTNALFIRKNPNTGNYGAGLHGNAEQPVCDNVLYAPKWGAGDYDFALTVTLLPANAHKIAWSLTGVAPLEYKLSGVFTNTISRTIPPAFDQVGFLGGAALFTSASTSNSIALKNVTVTLSHAGGEK